MTDRIKGLTVTLCPDTRDDDAEATINAIRMIKGVIDVQSHVADSNHHFAVVSARATMQMKIRDCLKNLDSTT